MERQKVEMEAFKMLVDMLAQTGDPRMVFVKKHDELRDRCHKMAINKSITDEQFKGLTSIISQCKKLIDDYIKENGINE